MLVFKKSAFFCVFFKYLQISSIWTITKKMICDIINSRKKFFWSCVGLVAIIFQSFRDIEPKIQISSQGTYQNLGKATACTHLFSKVGHLSPQFDCHSRYLCRQFKIKMETKKSKKIKLEIKGFKSEKKVHGLKKYNFAIWFLREIKNVGIPQIVRRQSLTWTER